MKTRILLWSIFFALATAFGADSTAPMQSITLNDGSKVTFLGITYGKHHEAPNFETLGSTLKTGHWIDRPNDVAVAWMAIEHDRTNFPDYFLLVSDKAESNGVEVKVDRLAISHVREGLEVEGFELLAYPRWDEEFYLRVYSENRNCRLSDEKFLATNLNPKALGDAVAEQLPVTKTSGDLTVTLTNLVGESPAPPYFRPDRDYSDPPNHWRELVPSDPNLHAVRFGFDFKEKGHPAPNWHLESVVVADAVGNYVKAHSHFQDLEDMVRRWPFVHTPTDDYKGYVFWPGLWPNEPAWNVRFEFSRISDFAKDEIVTFTNLPVTGTPPGKAGRSEFPFTTEQSVQGANLRIYSSEIQPDGKFLNVNLNADLKSETALRLTLIEASDEQGRQFEVSQYREPFLPDERGIYSFALSDPHETKRLNLKFAVHRSRYVTFTVNPGRQ